MAEETRSSKNAARGRSRVRAGDACIDELTNRCYFMDACVTSSWYSASSLVLGSLNTLFIRPFVQYPRKGLCGNSSMPYSRRLGAVDTKRFGKSNGNIRAFRRGKVGEVHVFGGRGSRGKRTLIPGPKSPCLMPLPIVKEMTRPDPKCTTVRPLHQPGLSRLRQALADRRLKRVEVANQCLPLEFELCSCSTDYCGKRSFSPPVPGVELLESPASHEMAHGGKLVG